MNQTRATSRRTWANERRRFGIALSLAVLGVLVGAPLAAQPEACAACHPDEARSYLETGMGRSFAPLTRANNQADFQSRNSFYHAASQRYYQATERDGRFYLRRWQQDSDGRPENIVEKQIHYALGSGNHAVAFLHRTPDDRLLQLPVTWYSDRGGFWAMAPGYDRPDHAGFRRKIDLECMFCHNGYPKVEGPELPGASVRFPPELPAGIDCARCHGPGERHLAAAQAGEPPQKLRAEIVNPASLASDRQLEVCLQCHLETTTSPLPHAIRRWGRDYFSFEPGQRLADYALHFDHAAEAGRGNKFEVVGAAYRLRASRCFQSSKGALTCTTCHDPHHLERGASGRARHNAICRNCHAQTGTASGPHTTDADCVSCHMPQRPAEDALHVRMTDHRIQAPPSPGAAQLADETGGEAYRGRVDLYYPPRLENDPDREIYLALAQVRDFANLDTGLPRLARAIRRRPPEAPEPHYFLAEGYRQQGDLAAAGDAYRAALERQSAFWPALRGLGLALAATGDLGAAAEALEAAAKQAPTDVAVAVALGDIYFRMSRLDDARRVLSAALEANPDSPEAHDNLGVVHFARNAPAAAEAEFREAIRHRPDYGAAHGHLAAVLLASGRLEQSIRSYELAVALGETADSTLTGYAQALTAVGRQTEAAEIRRRLESRP
ncbi:MAG: tetratricopeptide repeat protein [Acidobacteria bacterium]|nr:tetratricopeptide repeat protein [Acidobacteriota bacterium]